MTPDQRKAHLALHNQTMLDDWALVVAQGQKLNDAYTLWLTSVSSYESALHTHYRQEMEKFNEAKARFAYAVDREFRLVSINWTSDGCLLGNGETYLYKMENAL